MLILTIVCCILLAYQDFKSREVNILVLICLFVGSLAITFDRIGFEVYTLTAINMLLIFILFTCLFIYFSLKKMKITNILDTKIGKGDLVILLAITPLFIPENLMTFIVFSVLIALVISIPLKIKKIPLAGFISVGLLSFFILEKINFINGLLPFYSISWN